MTGLSLVWVNEKSASRRTRSVNITLGKDTSGVSAAAGSLTTTQQAGDAGSGCGVAEYSWRYLGAMSPDSTGGLVSIVLPWNGRVNMGNRGVTDQVRAAPLQDGKFDAAVSMFDHDTEAFPTLSRHRCLDAFAEVRSSRIWQRRMME